MSTETDCVRMNASSVWAKRITPQVFVPANVTSAGGADVLTRVTTKKLNQANKQIKQIKSMPVCIHWETFSEFCNIFALVEDQ